MEPPNPCEPKPRAFVTKHDREVAFAVSGGDCPPGVRADPTEAQKQRMKDAKAACAGVRPSADFKRCVIDAFRAMSVARKPAPSAPPPEPEPPPMAPPMFTVQQLPPHLQPFALGLAQPPPPAPTVPAPPPAIMRPPRAAIVATGPNALPPLLPPPPPAPAEQPPRIPEGLRRSYQSATDRWLAADYPLRVPLQDFGVADAEYWNYLRRSYPAIPVCERIPLRIRPTGRVTTEDRAVRERVADSLVRGYGR
jgi:hypothetical protein